MLLDVVTLLSDMVSAFTADDVAFRDGVFLLVKLISVVLGFSCLIIGRYAHAPLLWALFCKLFGTIGDKLNKKGRPDEELIFRGTLFFVFVAGLTWSLLSMIAYIWPMAAWVWDVVVLSAVVFSSAPLMMLFRVYKGMKEGAFDPRLMNVLTRATLIDFSKADNHTIARASFSYVVRRFIDNCVGPSFYYIIFGLEGALLYTLSMMFIWRFGDQGNGSAFAGVVLMFGAALQVIPNFLASVIMVIAGLLTPGTQKDKIFACAGASIHQGGRALAVFANAQGVTLGGAYSSASGHAIKGRWVGEENGTAKIGVRHFKRAIYMLSVAYVLVSLVIAGLYIFLA